MTPEELNKILAAHREWVVRGRTGDGRARLADADLHHVVLHHALLRGACLRGAYLRGAYLRYADLRGAYLDGADLRGAFLAGAYLDGADLRRAGLRGAFLADAVLDDADLDGAFLDGAYLDGALGAPRNASVQWDAHGECGRRLSAYRHSDGSDRYTCGRAVGFTLDEMRAWIEDNDAALRTSRLRALRIVAELMEDAR